MIISASSRKGNTSETTRKKIAVIVHKSGTKGVECFSKLWVNHQRHISLHILKIALLGNVSPQFLTDYFKIVEHMYVD